MAGVLKYILIFSILFAAGGSASGDSNDFEVDGMWEAALDLPKILFLLKRVPSEPPIEVESEFVENWAFLDTGASGILLSPETADMMGIAREPGAQFVDTGIGGDELFDVSEPLYVGTLDYESEVSSNPDVYDLYPQWRFQVSREYSEWPSEPLDVLGMPVMAGRVAVFRPISDFDIGWEFGTLDGEEDEGGRIVFSAYITDANDPNIPATDFEVALRFEKYINKSNPGNVGPLPALAYNPVIDNVTVEKDGLQSTCNLLLDTGGTISVISVEHGMALGLVDENGEPIGEYDFSVPIGGIGGEVELPGFTLDRLSIPTMNGFNLVYLNARVCVHDIGILDEDSGEFEIIDGIFGDNFICASMKMETWDISTTPYDNVVMDTVRGVLGFDVNSAYPVPVRRFTDIDADCDVDLDDLAVMSANWLRTDCGSGNDYCDYTDIDKDSDVDFGDYVFLASEWLKEDCQYSCGSERLPRPGADFSGDCEVDILDLQIAAEEWLKECDWLNYNCRGADMARDGVVNFEDFGEFANQMRVRP